VITEMHSKNVMSSLPECRSIHWLYATQGWDEWGGFLMPSSKTIQLGVSHLYKVTTQWFVVDLNLQPS